MSEKDGEQIRPNRVLPVSQSATEYAMRHFLNTPNNYDHYHERLEQTRPTLMNSLRYLQSWRVTQVDVPILQDVMDSYFPTALAFFGAAERQAKLTVQRLPKVITTDIGDLIYHQFSQAGQGDYYTQFLANLPQPTQPYPKLNDELSQDSAQALFDGASAYIDDVGEASSPEFTQRFFDVSREVLDHSLQRFVEQEAVFVQTIASEQEARQTHTAANSLLIGAMDMATLLEVAYLRRESH